MTLRHLQVFLTVCEERTVTAAAEKLYISQPAVSMAVMELEKNFGIRLFDRISRKLYITAEGEEFLEYARRILGEYRAMQDRFATHGGMRILRVGCGIAVGKLMMPSMARRFADHNSDVELRVIVNNSQTIEAMLHDAELDVGIMESNYVQNDRLERLVLQTNPLVAICHRDSPLTKQQRVTVEDLAREKLLMRERDSDTREAIEQTFRKHGVRIKPSWESVSAMALINAVGMGLGVSVLPRNYVKAMRNESIVMLQVEGMDLNRFIHIVYHKGRNISENMLRFIEFCQNYVIEMQEEIECK